MLRDGCGCDVAAPRILQCHRDAQADAEVTGLFDFCQAAQFADFVQFFRPQSLASNCSIPGSCRFNSAWLKGKKSLRSKKASVDSAKYSIGLVIAQRKQEKDLERHVKG